jgi:hypothetical protein
MASNGRCIVIYFAAVAQQRKCLSQHYVINHDKESQFKYLGNLSNKDYKYISRVKGISDHRMTFPVILENKRNF